MYILFDIGGSKTRVAASSDCKELMGDPVIFDSTNDFDTDLQSIATEAKKLAGDTPIVAAGGGIAGVLSPDGSQLIRSPNKQSWIGKPLQKTLATALNAPVVLENDTAVVGLGEAHAGAGKGHDIIAYITVSTGVGGAFIEHGRIGPRRLGFEPGHQYINTHCAYCDACTVKDPAQSECLDLEQLVSGSALEKKTGMKPYEVEDLAIWHDLARLLAIGLNNTVVHWSPDAIVLGGSMIAGKLGPVIGIDDIKKHLSEALTIFPEVPAIKKATLGDFGGIHGAMALLRGSDAFHP